MWIKLAKSHCRMEPLRNISERVAIFAGCPQAFNLLPDRIWSDSCYCIGKSCLLTVAAARWCRIGLARWPIFGCFLSVIHAQFVVLVWTISNWFCMPHMLNTKGNISAFSYQQHSTTTLMIVLKAFNAFLSWLFHNNRIICGRAAFSLLELCSFLLFCCMAIDAELALTFSYHDFEWKNKHLLRSFPRPLE